MKIAVVFHRPWPTQHRPSNPGQARPFPSRRFRGRHAAGRPYRRRCVRWQSPLVRGEGVLSRTQAAGVRSGQNPDTFHILPSLQPVVGRTRSEAEDLAAELLASTPDPLIVEDVSHSIGQDLTGRSVDEPFQFAPDIDTSNESRSPNRRTHALQAADRPRTPREVNARSFRQPIIVGTGPEIADHFEERVIEGAADGFTVASLTLPHSLDRFVYLVTPELPRRGLTSERYGHGPLRERLGLQRPARQVRTGK